MSFPRWALAALAAASLHASPGLLASPARAQQARLTPDSVNAAEFPQERRRGISPAMIRLQVMLDRARFSPGVVDGQAGENVDKAVAAYRAANGLGEGGRLDQATWDRLTAASPEPVLTEYTLTEEDVRGPFTPRIPSKMEEMAALDRLGYTGPLEAVAERFHMDEDLLKALNPGRPVDQAGTVLVVANVRREAPPERKAARIEVEKGERALRVFDQEGGLLAFYPASIGSDEKPAPSGEHTVTAVARNPTYTYNPDYNFQGVKAREKFTIKPGPNNPVGAAWVDLSIESYGIHGTPEPEKVGKAYSHGCVRLTNWDVDELARMVSKGTKVVFKE